MNLPIAVAVLGTLLIFGFGILEELVDLPPEFKNDGPVFGWMTDGQEKALAVICFLLIVLYILAGLFGLFGGCNDIIIMCEEVS